MDDRELFDFALTGRLNELRSEIAEQAYDVGQDDVSFFIHSRSGCWYVQARVRGAVRASETGYSLSDATYRLCQRLGINAPNAA